MFAGLPNMRLTDNCPCQVARALAPSFNLSNASVHRFIWTIYRTFYCINAVVFLVLCSIVVRGKINDGELDILMSFT